MGRMEYTAEQTIRTGEPDGTGDCGRTGRRIRQTTETDGRTDKTGATDSGGAEPAVRTMK